MSQLNPGGLRAAPFGRVFGFESIGRVCNQALKRRTYRSTTSIAQGNRHGGQHEHKREIARRLRQQSARG